MQKCKNILIGITINKYSIMGNNIIVIDDDVGTALFFKICLEDQGHQVSIYNDPNSLLEEFEPGIYDLLITDIRMPRINGFELASRIRING